MSLMNRTSVLCVNCFVGLMQLSTIVFLFIGWFWSIIWGCAFVGLSGKLFLFAALLFTLNSTLCNLHCTDAWRNCKLSQSEKKRGRTMSGTDEHFFHPNLLATILALHTAFIVSLSLLWSICGLSDQRAKPVIYFAESYGKEVAKVEDESNAWLTSWNKFVWPSVAVLCDLTRNKSAKWNRLNYDKRWLCENELTSSQIIQYLL